GARLVSATVLRDRPLTSPPSTIRPSGGDASRNASSPSVDQRPGRPPSSVGVLGNQWNPVSVSQPRDWVSSTSRARRNSCHCSIPSVMRTPRWVECPPVSHHECPTTHHECPTWHHASAAQRAGTLMAAFVE